MVSTAGVPFKGAACVRVIDLPAIHRLCTAAARKFNAPTAVMLLALSLSTSAYACSQDALLRLERQLKGSKLIVEQFVPAGKAYLIPCPAFKVTCSSTTLIQPSMPCARWPAPVALYMTDAHQCEPFTCAVFAHGYVDGICQWCCSWTGGQCCAPLVMAAHRSAAARRRSTAASHAAPRSRRHCTGGDRGWHPECTAMSPALVQQCSSAQCAQG